MDETASDNDQQLLSALRSGEAGGFERLVRAYMGRLLAVAERILVNQDDAQDAVQDAFLSAFRSLDTFDGRSLLSTWLHRITVNVALMKLRSKRRHPEQSIDQLMPAFAADGHHASRIARWNRSPQEISEQAEIKSLVRSKIQELPDSYRIVLILRDIEEMDSETVAEMLETTPGALKVRLHRARQALRTLLDPIFGGPAE